MKSIWISVNGPSWDKNITPPWSTVIPWKNCFSNWGSSFGQTSFNSIQATHNFRIHASQYPRISTISSVDTIFVMSPYECVLCRSIEIELHIIYEVYGKWGKLSVKNVSMGAARREYIFNWQQHIMNVNAGSKELYETKRTPRAWPERGRTWPVHRNVAHSAYDETFLHCVCVIEPILSTCGSKQDLINLIFSLTTTL